MNVLRHIDMTLWMGYRRISRTELTQDSTTQKNVDIHPRLNLDSNPRSQNSKSITDVLHDDWSKTCKTYVSVNICTFIKKICSY